jgi:hypothetical protein
MQGSNIDDILVTSAHTSGFSLHNVRSSCVKTRVYY